MRELKVIGLDAAGKLLICQTKNSAEKLALRVDDRLKSLINGEPSPTEQTAIDIEVSNVLTPKEIQARIRAGASVEQVATSAGVDVARVERFANPVLLERARAAELATAARPVLHDGPAVESLRERVTAALIARSLDHGTATWDAWKGPDARWTVQLRWQAGRSENVAHFRFIPGAHGGTVTPLDEAASELIDPRFDRPLRRVVAPVPQLDFDDATPEPQPQPDAVPPAAPAAGGRRRRPAVPAWEDVLLGVRSTGQR